MRIPFPRPCRETGFARIQRRYPRHRCDLFADGYACEAGQRVYDWDNRQRSRCQLFQYTLAGEGRFQCLPDGEPVTVIPGQAILVPMPSATRYWLAPGTRWEFCYILMGGDLAEDLVSQLVHEYGYLWTIPEQSVPIDLLRGLHQDITSGRPPDEFSAAAFVHRFLMELYRLKTIALACPGPLDAAKRQIEQHFMDPDLRIAHIATVCGISRFHFSRRFKAAFGDSPQAYLLRVRLRKAVELLATTTWPVKRIAVEVGYKDAAHFCREFRNHFRRSPGEWRHLGAGLRFDAMFTSES